MIKHHSPYHAFTGKRLPEQSAVSPLVQHYVDGSVSRDTILLLPILCSSQESDQPSPCLHLVHQPDGTPRFCTMHTLHRCPCCGGAMCYSHQSERSVLLPDESGTWQPEDGTLLCKTCAHFSTDMIYAIYTFRHEINSQGQVQ